MGRNSKFSKEEKIEACERYRNGEGSFKSIEKEIGSQKIAVMRWYYTYIEHGDSFLIVPIIIKVMIKSLNFL